MPEQTWPEARSFGDLTTEHYGLLVEWQPPAHPDGFLPMRRSAVCDELRRWVHNGVRRVEMIDLTPDELFAGKSWSLDADTPVTVLRRIRKARKRPWGKGALKHGEQWSMVES